MDEAFIQRLQAAFRIEAEEHLQAMSAGLLDIERLLAQAPDGEWAQSPEMATLTETIFREAHSLKGASRAVNFHDIEAICQSLEDVFAKWKAGERPNTEGFDALHQALDAIEKILSQGTEQPPYTQSQLAAIVRQIKEGKKTSGPAPSVPPPPANGVPVAPPPPPQEPVSAAPPATPVAVTPASQPAQAPAAPPPSAPVTAPAAPPTLAASVAAATVETIRIATGKLDALLLQAEEMVVLKQTARQRLYDLRNLENQLAAWRKEWSKAADEVAARASDAEVAGVGELFDKQRNYLQTLEGKLAALAKASEQDSYAAEGLVDNLLEDTKKLVMQPFSTILAVFPRLVRDLARELGKEVDFEMRGSDVEIDKRILEEMKAPLTHLIRNSVDHGLEMSEVRRERGKSSQGSLSINIAHTAGKIEIEIRDDGGGIDAGAVKAAAVRGGSLSPTDAERMSDEEAVQLIFRSAVSTSPIVTELSGRGLGMAIVREKVENLGGEVLVKTEQGHGTTFLIRLPLTLATFRGLLVAENSKLFIVPTLNVDRVLRVRRDEIQTVEGRATVTSAGQVLGYVRLASVLGMTSARTGEEEPFVFAMVVSGGGVRIAFGVDEVLDEQEVLLKSFGKPLVRVRHFSGASMLGSGEIAPVLNASDLIQSAVQGATSNGAIMTEGREEKRMQRILVTDDSITSRMLIKNILEAAGYVVNTATDGMDALTELRAGQYDLLVSDVDMPRMNGFGLTSAVRADARLAEMPVVLVTGRETREDRERGIDVGASAYVVKSSFDQSNLLEIVSRLL